MESPDKGGLTAWRCEQKLSAWGGGGVQCILGIGNVKEANEFPPLVP